MQYYINGQELPQNALQTKRNTNPLQNEVRDWSKSLFDAFFKPQQLTPLITHGQTFLIKILAKSGSYFHRNIAKHYKRTLIFLANYHKMMHIYSLKYHTPITNDMALHFIILLGYSRLKDDKIDQAKNVFKNVWQYVNIKSCDKVMIGVALSNLTFLHLNNQKPFKALQSSLKCIQIMGQHLAILKKQNLRHQMVQDSVILINSLILCRKSLLKILSTTQKSFYLELYRYINEIGYKCSKRYLGQQSDFTKVFANYKNLGKLPVYFEASVEQSVERTTLEQKILQQLQGIYEVLKTKRQPEIVYVNQPQVIEPPPPVRQPSIVEPLPQKQVSEKSQVIIIQPKDQPPIQDEIQAGQSISFSQNGWAIQGHLLRPKNLAEKMSASGQFCLGNLVLQYSKKRKQMKEVISVERIEKILALIDYESSLLYEYALKRINDQEFFNFFVFPHIEIDEQGHLKFIIQKKSIINPFESTFLQTKSLIFVNYILGNNLRIRISALDTSLNVHINLELRPITFLKLFEVKQQLPELIHSVYEKIKQSQYQKQIEIPQLFKHETTQVTVKNEDLLKKLITNFLKDFQQFLLEIEQEQDGDLKFQDFLSNYEDELDENIFITFIEAKPNAKNGNFKSSQKPQQMSKIKGRFTFCKYVSNIHSIEIFSQNNYATFNIDSQSYAKGTMTIYGDKFEADFGVSIQYFEKNHMIKSILQIVAKRYELKMFFSPLKTHDEELYNQNAICELPLICKSYRRAVVEDENGFMVLVTISHLTVNNQVPLAFKVDAYFPCEGCAQYSILIKIQPSMWEKPVEEMAKKQVKQGQKGKQTQDEDNKQNSHINSQDYGFKKDYFLIEWCQMEGYQQMMRLFTIEDMIILVKNSESRFYSLERLFQNFR